MTSPFCTAFYTETRGKDPNQRNLQSAKLSGQGKFAGVDKVMQSAQTHWVTAQECAQECTFHATPVWLQTFAVLSSLDNRGGKRKKAQGQQGCPGWVPMAAAQLGSLHGCQGGWAVRGTHPWWTATIWQERARFQKDTPCSRRPARQRHEGGEQQPHVLRRWQAQPGPSQLQRGWKSPFSGAALASVGMHSVTLLVNISHMCCGYFQSPVLRVGDCSWHICQWLYLLFW